MKTQINGLLKNSYSDSLQRMTQHATIPRSLTRGQPGNAGQCSGTEAVENQQREGTPHPQFTPPCD